MDIVRVPTGFWIVGQGNGNVTILRSSDHKLVKISVPQPAWDLDFAAELNLLGVACGDGAVRTFDVTPDGHLDAHTRYGLSSRIESGPPRPFQTVCLADLRNQILAGDDSGRLVVWDLDDPAPTFIREDQSPGRLSNARRDQLPQFLRRCFSAIHVVPDGNTVLTTGQNTCVNRWDFSETRGRTEFSVGGKQPIIAFDREDDKLLWVACSDGELSLWDSRASAKVASQLIEGGLNGLAMAAESRVVATCSDRTIHFWHRSRHEIRASREPLRHKLHLRNIALSPNGNRVAGYDQEDNVILWDVRTGKSKTVSMAAEDGEAAVAGVMAFNVDGTTLAAAGPGQSLWVLDGESLKLINKPYLVAGRGGTALAWHPTDRQVLFTGDTAGRISGRHLLDNRQLTGTPIASSEIVGLTFSPTGDRIVTVDQLGTIEVVDPMWIGKVLEFHSNHATSENRPNSLAFDPTGSRLALAHADGIVQIWETAAPPLKPDIERGELAMTRREWRSATVVEGREAARLQLREPSVALDQQDRLWILHTAVPEETRQVVRIAQESPHGTRIQTLEEIDLTKVRSEDDVRSSLALLLFGNRLWATLRRPRPDDTPISGQIIGYHRQLAGGPDGPWNEEPFSRDLDNFGFLIHLFEGPNDKPAAVHFSWNGFYLYGTYWTGLEWRHERVGRQGDGNGLHAVQGSDGTIHTLFKPMRFGADPSPSIYLAFQFPQQRDGHCSIVHREVFDCLGQYDRIAALPDETLIVASGNELVSRSDSGWTTLVGSQQSAPLPTYDPTGHRYFFADTDSTGRQILLTSVTDGQATTERVWTIPADLDSHPQVITRVNSRGLPIVVAYSGEVEQGWLRVFRTDEDLSIAGNIDVD
jgi:WD40 repeat protein